MTMKEKKTPTLTRVEQTRVVWRGITETARHLGCSRAHLSYVLHGQRKPSDRLARRLARMGVTCTVDGKKFEEVR